MNSPNDPVFKPAHYNDTELGLEVFIDELNLLGAEGFIAGCLFNAIKYIARAGKKGSALEDLKKAWRYIGVAIDVMEGKLPGGASRSKALKIRPSGDQKTP